MTSVCFPVWILPPTLSASRRKGVRPLSVYIQVCDDRYFLFKTMHFVLMEIVLRYYKIYLDVICTLFPGATQCDDHKQKRERETKRVFLGKFTFPLIKMIFPRKRDPVLERRLDTVLAKEY
jgi:hypothetical protein